MTRLRNGASRSRGKIRTTCAPPKPATVFRVEAPDGAAIEVRRHGNPQGPRLVLSHGNGFSADAYYPYWSHFLDGFDLFVHDLRNHGWNSMGERGRHNMPRFVTDGESILEEIGRRFGIKPVTGVFHSVSATVALHQACRAGEFEALVLFDPPLMPPGGMPRHMEGVCTSYAEYTRKRRERFASPSELADSLAQSLNFRRIESDHLELLAASTLRAADGGYELCCPKEYEAQVYDSYFAWAMTVDLEHVRCPVKVIGGDPTVQGTFMPSMDLHELALTDYDFVPEASHLLVLEQPGLCAELTAEFLSQAH